jgi:hypothetical protein
VGSAPTPSTSPDTATDAPKYAWALGSDAVSSVGWMKVLPDRV